MMKHLGNKKKSGGRSRSEGDGKKTQADSMNENSVLNLRTAYSTNSAAQTHVAARRIKPLLGKTKHLDRGFFVFIFVHFLNAFLLPCRPFSKAIN